MNKIVDIETLMIQANAQLNVGHFKEAIKSFSSCLAHNPNEMRALRGRARLNLQLKNWNLAMVDFEAAKELNPTDSENWLGLGMCLSMESKVYEAIKIFEELIARQPDYSQGYIQLALLYLKVGAISKAKEQLLKALDCPISLKERQVIESMLLEQGKLDKNRYYRPDFELLKKQKKGMTSGD